MVENTKSVTIRDVSSGASYTLSLSAQNGYIFVSPNLSSYPAGTQVYLHAHADDSYVFDHWSGNAGGSDPTIYLTMDGSKSVTANFAVDTSIGHLTVDIQPPQAVAEGAQWRTNYYTSWRNSGDTLNSPPRHDTVRFKDIPGWVTPPDNYIEIIGGQTTYVTGTYQEILGGIQATISPPEAVNAGAQWRVDSGAWQNSGVAVASLSPGNHTVDFRSVASWQTPTSQTVAVARGNTSIVAGNYGPPLGCQSSVRSRQTRGQSQAARVYPSWV